MIEDFEVVIDEGRRKIVCNGAMYEVEEFCEVLSRQLSSAEPGEYLIGERNDSE